MPGEAVGLNESMIKSLHKNLQGKIKFTWKPCPIENKVNNMADGHYKILVKFELYEGEDEMQEKE